MRQIKGLLLGMVYVCLAAVITVNGVLLAKRLIYKEALPSILGYSMVTVLSGSMEPEFSPGDLLIIKKQGSYLTGDIVTYQDQGAFITHRIVRKEGHVIQTKGDANNAPDGITLSSSDLYGTVKFVVPGLGQMVLFFKSSLGNFALIVLFLALVEFSFWSERKAKKEKQVEA